MMDSRRRRGTQVLRLFGTPRTTSEEDCQEVEDLGTSGIALHGAAADARAAARALLLRPADGGIVGVTRPA